MEVARLFNTLLVSGCEEKNAFKLNQSQNFLTVQRPEIGKTNAVRHQLGDLSRKNDIVVQLVYTGQKIKGQFKPKECKPQIVNQQNVYYYKYGLCDADYVGFTSRHLHQLVEELISDQQSATT